MSGLNTANVEVVRLAGRVDALEARTDENQADIKDVLRKLDHLQWWIIGVLLSVIGGLSVQMLRH